jgi:hypothetical protein
VILGWDAGAGVVPAVQPILGWDAVVKVFSAVQSSVGRTVWQSGVESSAEVSRADTISGQLMREEVQCELEVCHFLAIGLLVGVKSKRKVL